MKKQDEAKAEFLKNVATHTMDVRLDQGVHRHLLFRRPGGGAYWFELVTWPGRLSISGDMGDFTFSRLPDMFEFFRTKPSGAEGLHINRSYWAEKVTAQCRHGNGVQEFSPELWRAAVVQHFREYTRSHGKIVPGLKQAIRDEVLHHEHDGEHEAYNAVNRFQHGGRGGFVFQDFFEHRLKDYTMPFVWCCYAIQWGIQQYDAERDTKLKAAMEMTPAQAMREQMRVIEEIQFAERTIPTEFAGIIERPNV